MESWNLWTITINLVYFLLCAYMMKLMMRMMMRMADAVYVATVLFCKVVKLRVDIIVE
jgi:hypothetical protein